MDTGVPAKGFGKKRGRKEDLRSRKEAAHGFRNLSVIKIIPGFEHPITDLKTKSDKFVNKIKDCLTVQFSNNAVILSERSESKDLGSSMI